MSLPEFSGSLLSCERVDSHQPQIGANVIKIYCATNIEKERFISPATMGCDKKTWKIRKSLGGGAKPNIGSLGNVS